MAIDRRTLEGIEACRPGSDDLQSPQLSDVAREVESNPEAQAAYRRVQAWDAAIAGALEQVPLPAGLAERILDQLKAGQPAAAGKTISASMNSALAVPADGASAESDASPSCVRSPWLQLRPGSRRRWLAAASAVAATVLVAVLVARHLRSDVDTPVETMADVWLAGLGSQWHDMHEAPPDFEIPSAIMAEPAGWQRLARVAGGRGVAYQLVHRNAGTAKLFVVRLAVAGLPASPPATPQSSTGGKSIGYWRSGAHLYVLVVEGNERSYRAFVNSSRMPLA